MANFDFLNQIRTRLENLWGNPGGDPLKPLHVKEPKIMSPIPQDTPTPTPTPQPVQPTQPTIPGGTDLAMNYLQTLVPQGQTPQQYFPPLADTGFMGALAEADKKRQGLSNLLLMQALFESTLGRNSPNLFGVLPGGEGASQGQSFQSPTDALNYQLSPAVLGGGGNPNMNILNTNAPITEQDVRNLYSSYNPQGAYVDPMLSILFGK